MVLEVTTLTLGFDPLLGGFPNELIRDYLHERELVAVDAYPFAHAGRPYWSLCLTTRRLQGAEALSGAEARRDGPAYSGGAEGHGPDPAAREAVRSLLREMDGSSR